MSKLHLGEGFALPREALLHVWSILAVRGAGKTYTASVLVEEILAHKMMPVIVIDPMDAWYGLKSSADGRREGYSIIVMGGTHADVPLEPTGGALVADFFIEHRQSLILVPAQGDHRWPRAQQVRFVADFGARLYERNAGQLVFLTVDEADIFANQRPGTDELRCLGVMEDIVKRGRKPGIFPLLITQRSSNLNKNVLDETEMLVAMRTMSPRDQDALKSWFTHLPKAQHARKEQLLETWAKLPNGTAWFWCPPIDLFRQVKIRERHTFNSSATPKFGEKPVEPKVLAPVDLEILTRRMAATIERAKQTDPRELQREVARLRIELARKPDSAAVQSIKERRVEVPVLKDGQVMRLEKVAGRWLTGVDRLVEIAKGVGDQVHALQTVLAKVRVNGAGPPAPPPARVPSSVVAPAPRPVLPRAVRRGPGEVLPIGEQRVLSAVAQYPDGVTRQQLTVLTGYKRSSRDTYLQRLQVKEYVAAGRGDRIVTTDAGFAALGDRFEPLPTGSALRDYWLTRLPEGERKLLAALLDAFPGTVEREALSKVTGYARSSRDTYLQRLGAKHLVVRQGREGLRAADHLFEDRLVPA